DDPEKHPTCRSCGAIRGSQHQRKGCMLVLSRRKNETILIDGVIQIEVLNVTKGTVRVGLSAPKSTQVIRSLVKAELRSRGETGAKSNPTGMDTLNLTMVSQQIV